jgi:HK97 gp10 family phage protein
MAEAGGIRYELQIDDAAIQRLAGGPDVTKALVSIGQVGEKSAKENVRVDTGNLRRSITHELGQYDPLHRYVRIGTNVTYGLFQEIGTRFMSPQPFLRPAMEAIRRFVKAG